jgi:hypothetical protein
MNICRLYSLVMWPHQRIYGGRVDVAPMNIGRFENCFLFCVLRFWTAALTATAPPPPDRRHPGPSTPVTEDTCRPETSLLGAVAARAPRRRPAVRQPRHAAVANSVEFSIFSNFVILNKKFEC